jgi:hypothetical protein
VWGSATESAGGGFRDDCSPKSRCRWSSALRGNRAWFHDGRPPRNKGLQYPADPPTVEEIVAVMRCAGDQQYGRRCERCSCCSGGPGCGSVRRSVSLKAIWTQAAVASLSAAESAGGVVRSGGTDGRGITLTRGSRFVSDRGGRAAVRHRRPDPSPTVVTDRGSGHAARARRDRWRAPGVAPHQLRTAHAVEMAREGVPLNVIQRQLGHANLGITSIYLQGIDSSEIINAVHSRPAPVIPATASLGSML